MLKILFINIKGFQFSNSIKNVGYNMTALLITSFIILLSYILYAGVAESLSATYYKVKKPYLFQIALGLTGFLMMLSLLDMTAGNYRVNNKTKR